jgi:ATP-dependent Zn protease
MPAKPKAKRTAKRGRLGYAIEHAAYHEAGHAVLALVCQATVRRATIKPRGTTERRRNSVRQPPMQLRACRRPPCRYAC